MCSEYVSPPRGSHTSTSVCVSQATRGTSVTRSLVSTITYTVCYLPSTVICRVVKSIDEDEGILLCTLTTHPPYFRTDSDKPS